MATHFWKPLLFLSRSQPTNQKQMFSQRRTGNAFLASNTQPNKSTKGQMAQC